MVLSTSKRLLLFCLYVSLASCRSEQIVFQAATPPEQHVSAVSNLPVVVYEARANNMDAPVRAQGKSLQMALPSKGQKATIKKRIVRAAAVARQAIRPRLLSKSNITAVREVQDEGEGQPALLVLGILLVLAGIAGGFLIGGGIGFFVGLPIGLLGYYFFMKGLLGPNAWIEVGNELFQL
ncbi:hypothetical protein [Hymenobacter sp. GOD-10R]|uniref:hypothetical protein n=1 Tax=Hymenobacter sp. GOD-10R TaxID=3093922 RepID=UPI002D78C44F|nr:hypothetical protein [Hymenobacter sp. GOD-10R]WRQ28880.1 hypothetical protein SD425_01205 [Hymenobacter sp. GOD-10R]